METRGRRALAAGSHHARPRVASRRVGDPQIARLEALDPRRPPRRSRGLVAHESLAVEVSLWTKVRRRKRQLVVHARLVLRGGADLDHLEPGGALEHPMADAWWLKRAVASAQDERLALVFVDDTHPAARAVDHLERHEVEVHV